MRNFLKLFRKRDHHKKNVAKFPPSQYRAPQIKLPHVKNIL